MVVPNHDPREQGGVLQVWLGLGRGDRDAALVQLALMEVKNVLGDGVKKIVGHQHQRVGEGALVQERGGVQQPERLGLAGVEMGEIEDAALDKGLELGVAAPKVYRGADEIGHNVFEWQAAQPGLIQQAQELFEEVEGEAPRAGAQLDQVKRLGGVDRRGGVRFQTIPQESQNHPGVGIGDEGIAGDVVRPPPGARPRCSGF